MGLSDLEQRLIVQLEAQSDGMVKATKAANRALRETRKQAKKTSDASVLLRKAWTGLIGLGVVNTLRGIASAALDTGDALDRAQRVTGFSAEQIQKLSIAGEDFGVTMDITTDFLQQFTQKIGEAAKGEGNLADIVTDYKISLTDANNEMRSSEAIFGDYVRVLQTAGSAQEQLRLLTEVGEDAAAKLLPVLDGTSGSLEELNRRAEATGRVLSDEMVESLNTAADATTRMLNAVKDFSTLAVGKFAEQFFPNPEKEIAQNRALLKHYDELIAAGQADAKIMQVRADLLERQGVLMEAVYGNIRDFTSDGEQQATTLRKTVTVTNDLRSAAERLNEEFTGEDWFGKRMRELAEIQATGLLDPGVYQRAEDAARDFGISVEEALEGFSDAEPVRRFADAVENDATGAVGGLSDELSSLLIGAEADFARFFASLASDISRLAITSGIQQILGAFLGAGGGLGGGTVETEIFAKGGLTSGPELFATSSGLGVRGEAGVEAILPVTRGKGGRMGVDASGLGGVTVNVVNNAPNSPQNDGRLGRLVAGEVTKQMSGIARATMLDEQRVGGALNRV